MQSDFYKLHKMLQPTAQLSALASTVVSIIFSVLRNLQNRKSRFANSQPSS